MLSQAESLQQNGQENLNFLKKRKREREEDVENYLWTLYVVDLRFYTKL